MSTKTEPGSYFISNYPPFSQWSSEFLHVVEQAFHRPPASVPLGLYLHIPFCRKRCKFCYFRVYTDKNAPDVERYLTALCCEIELLSRLPVVGNRDLRFVYFGGGTPSYLSAKQLTSLVDQLQKNVAWNQTEEVTFECEPGTLSKAKVRTLKTLGVTRLSLGIENFSDLVLQENGRAHLSKEIYQAWSWIDAANFPNVNIDLIAGMIGETWENWRDCVQKTVALGPDSVTIYQLELPFNTVYAQNLLQAQTTPAAVDWPTKRAWVDYAFSELERAGYQVSSAYTMIKDPERVHFRYRDHLWRGSDLLASGVASFGHVSGTHYQNCTDWDTYIDALAHGKLPLHRGMRCNADELLVREVILQLKLGWLDTDYFQEKFSVNILEKWASVWQDYEQKAWLILRDRKLVLSRQGLLQIDALLPALFGSSYQGIRYT